MSRNRGTTWAFIVVIISFLLSTTVSLVSMHAMSQENERAVNKVLAMRVYDHISSSLLEPITVTKTMSSDYFLTQALQDESTADSKLSSDTFRSYLKTLEDGLGYDETFVVSAKTGRYYTHDGQVKVIDPKSEHDAWYPQFVDENKPYDLDVDVNESNEDEWTVYVNARVESPSGELLGVCGVGVRMTGIQQLFRTFEWDYGVKIDLVAPDGLVQVDTNEDDIERVYLNDVSFGPKDGNDYVYHDGGNRKFAVTKYVEDLDWYLVVQSGKMHEAVQVANVVILNLILCVLVMVGMIIAMRMTRRRTTELTTASFRDQSTALYNRRAFEEDKARLMKQPLSEDFVYVTVDINGLKTANDTLGHAAGDELIQGAAECMRKAFVRYGRVYRIGGDEFAAILTVPEDQLEPLKETFKGIVASWSGKKNASLSVSCGYASQREFPSENIAELSRISDERMYEDKTAYYQRTGTDRRQT